MSYIHKVTEQIQTQIHTVYTQGETLATGKLDEISIRLCLGLKVLLNKNNNRHTEQIERQLPRMPRYKC